MNTPLNHHALFDQMFTIKSLPKEFDRLLVCSDIS